MSLIVDPILLFSDCNDIGYYRDNITLEFTRVYLDLSFLFPDCDDIGYYYIHIQLSW